MSDDAISITTKLTRGTSTDDRDEIKAKVSASNIDELDERLEQVRDRLEDWAADLREIQPEGRRSVSDDQSTLGKAEA